MSNVHPAGLHGSYLPGDVTFLLTPLAMTMVKIAAKERLIQSGTRHYSEMLSAEHAPSAAYMEVYRKALAANGAKLAGHINFLADALAQRAGSAATVVLVSLVRAGTPMGVLLVRSLRRRGIEAVHYSISIIRGRGIDRAALQYIVARHGAEAIVFVDGWTGKGAIAAELRGADGAINCAVAPFLVVVADPAGCADLAATTDDYLIPSGILNGIVSGLVSRSVLNESIVPGMFHGCVLLDDLASHDVSREFVDTIDTLASNSQANGNWRADGQPAVAQASADVLRRIAEEHDVADRNRIKPGIAESTRAVLRRVPYKLLLADFEHADLQPLRLLASERGVPIGKLGAGHGYRAVAIIADVGGE